MEIKEILKEFNKQLNDFFNEERKNKPIAFQVDWRCEEFNEPIVDMNWSYWYFEDDGTIVFRINDIYDDVGLHNGSLIEFKNEFNEFLKEFGNTEQGECDTNIKDTFFFFTEDEDHLGGSYWAVNDFNFIDDGDKVIIKINDWG